MPAAEPKGGARRGTAAAGCWAAAAARGCVAGGGAGHCCQALLLRGRPGGRCWQRCSAGQQPAAAGHVAARCGGAGRRPAARPWQRQRACCLSSSCCCGRVFTRPACRGGTSCSSSKQHGSAGARQGNRDRGQAARRPGAQGRPVTIPVGGPGKAAAASSARKASSRPHNAQGPCVGRCGAAARARGGRAAGTARAAGWCSGRGRCGVAAAAAACGRAAGRARAAAVAAGACWPAAVRHAARRFALAAAGHWRRVRCRQPQLTRRAATAERAPPSACCCSKRQRQRSGQRRQRHPGVTRSAGRGSQAHGAHGSGSCSSCSSCAVRPAAACMGQRHWQQPARSGGRPQPQKHSSGAGAARGITACVARRGCGCDCRCLLALSGGPAVWSLALHRRLAQHSSAAGPVSLWHSVAAAWRLAPPRQRGPCCGRLPRAASFHPAAHRGRRAVTHACSTHCGRQRAARQ